MRGRKTVLAIATVVLLAGCGGPPPATHQEITIEETVDLDCDGRVSELTITATVSVPPDDASSVYGEISHLNNDGERAQIDTFDVDGETTYQATIGYDDLDVSDSTQLFVEAKEDNLISDETLGVDSTREIDVESREADQPVLDPTFDFNPEMPKPDEKVAFEVTETADEGCDIEIVDWDFTDDGTTNAQGTVVEHAFDEGGYHDVTATIVTESGVEFTLTDTMLVTDDEGVQFRDAADPMPRSMIVPQLVIQVFVTLGISLAVVSLARRR